MVLPVATGGSHRFETAKPAMNETRVPPHPGFYCRLQDMPDHLVPEVQVRGLRAAKTSTEHLRVNLDCRLVSGEDLPRELEDHAWLAKGFLLQPGELVALVQDTGTDAIHPFWLNLDTASQLITRGSDGLAGLNSQQQQALQWAGILTAPKHDERQRELWRNKISRCAPQFAELGYAPIAGLIHPFHIAALRRYYRQLIRCGGLELGDAQTPGRYTAHNEVVARFFHHELTNVFSRIAGELLKPSYVYLGAYQEGADLKEHVDRPQCEFSITLLLDYTPEPELQAPWPIHLRTREGRTTVFQAIGDALLYRGCRVPHSRGRLPAGHTSTSLFFHYVRKDFAGRLD